MNKNLLLAFALAFGAIGFGACSSASTNTVSTGNTGSTNAVNNNSATVNKPANANGGSVSPQPSNPVADAKPTMKTDDVVSADTSKNEKIGVAECDEYVAKYEACVNSKVPEAQRAALITPLDAMRKGWKSAATNDKTKAALAGGCKVALTTAKQSLSAFSCEW